MVCNELTFPLLVIHSIAPLQSSEKTLLLSSACKTSLETRYTQLYQSINDGHPINRLNQLRQLLPRIKQKSTTKQGHDSKTSMDQSRPRRPKGDKYKFVDKVEESSCIWDVDHMEARVLAAEAAEAAQAKAAAKSTSTDSFVQNSSSSRDSFGFSNTYHDSPLANMDSNHWTAGMSPSSTATSMSRPHGMIDSTSTFSLEPTGHSRSSKDLPGDSRLRFSESAETTPPSQQTTPPTITFAKEELPGIQEATASEASPSKRSSFLGIFGPRSKKVGHDGSESSYHQESPQSTSAYGSPRLSAFGANQERRSLDSPQSPHLQPAGPMQANQRVQPTVEIVPPSSFNSPSDHLAAQGAISGFSSKRASMDEEHRTNHFGEPGSAAMTDDDNGGHWAPPAFWPQGERMDDSQDESDTALTAAHKVKMFSIKCMEVSPFFLIMASTAYHIVFGSYVKLKAFIHSTTVYRQDVETRTKDAFIYTPSPCRIQQQLTRHQWGIFISQSRTTGGDYYVRLAGSG